MNKPRSTKQLQAIFKMMQEFNITELHDGDLHLTRKPQQPQSETTSEEPVNPLDELFKIAR